MKKVEDCSPSPLPLSPKERETAAALEFSHNLSPARLCAPKGPTASGVAGFPTVFLRISVPRVGDPRSPPNDGVNRLTPSHFLISPLGLTGRPIPHPGRQGVRRAAKT